MVLFTYSHLAGALLPEPARYPFADRVAAVAAAGGSAIATTVDDLHRALADSSPAELRAMLAGHDVRIGELEAIFGWFAGDNGPEDDVLRTAEMFGIPRIKTVVLPFPPFSVPEPDVLVERFARLCDRAAASGSTVALEPVVIIPGFDHAAAHDLVRTVDRPGVGLVLDAWQVFRDPAGPATVEALAAGHVAAVELTDGRASAGTDLLDDCVNGRRLPGEGDFDLAGLLRAVRAKGIDPPLSAEVLSPALRALTPADNAERTMAAIRPLLS
ncbi:sugar phosphate isomerase/epimerase family protein [Actinoplanes sp. NPDC049265]|uniref:sugar phosphate isomerase/epimerase family protein n=1 Tax=Actinoplanes sp. NPDC049265 TaxID=3363902 RepID=UPI0037185A14